MALSGCTQRSLLRSLNVTTLGRPLGLGRFAPVLAGLGCGALIAVVSVVVTPLATPPRLHSDPVLPVTGPQAVGPLPPDAGSQAAPISPDGPLLLPFPPPPPAPPAPSAPPAPPKPPVPPPIPLPPVLSGPAGQVVSITNAERRAHGCAPLTVDPRLSRAAYQHSKDMAVRGYFDHDTPEGRSFGDREIANGFPADKTGGENIAYGQQTAAIVMNVWMHSAGHRANILSCEFTTIGVGYYADGDYWTQDFGY
jgi:uncharacterized protein YkwD